MSAAAATDVLVPLREEIAIFPGPAALDGSPTWTLHDPTRNRFYRLGWREFEIISRWDSGSAQKLLQRVKSETPLEIERDEVDELSKFLLAFDLMRVTSQQATKNLVAKAERLRQSFGHWLLHNYLFMRIPLVRPDAFLGSTYRYIGWIFTRGFAIAIVAVGLIGLYLVARQWDAFLGTLIDMFSVQGLVGFVITLAALKAVHELGHAYTAKRYGCRVPSMGVALLVLVPVLYTDANEAWKLTGRRQRLAIGVAGVVTELGCAAIAACAWGFLPNGPARSVAFLVATSTWLTTVLINLSPFMRFDGYYVLSDWLEMPNLHTRAFVLAQWWLREKLLGLGDAPPEDLPPGRRRFLIAFAFLTWAYRFSLFLAIAVIVYAFTIKILGVLMAMVEIGYFVVWPVVWEMRNWWRRRSDVRWSPRTALTLTGVVAVLALLLVPWRSAVEAPAVLKSQQHVGVFVPDFGARLAAINVRNHDAVQKDAPLLQLVSPDIEHRLTQARNTIEILEWQMGAKGVDAELLARSLVTEREYGAALAEYRALLTQKARLDVTAPIVGRVVDIADGLVPGSWLPAKSRLLSVVDPTGVIVEAYVGETDLERIAVGDTAKFFAEADSRFEIVLRVQEIARASTRVLTDPTLASIHGGPLAVRATKQNALVPDNTVYRVVLVPVEATLTPERTIRGTIMLQGRAVSLAARAWRALLAVVIRESGA